MATTNFLQTNPAQMNQENDAAYLADSQRTGGLARNDEVPSILLNKVQYQASTFIAAFANMLAAKGIATSDADIAVLTTALATVRTTVDDGLPLSLLAFSATPTFDASTSNGWQMPLTGNVTSSTISGVKPGQELTFILVQDATGGRTVSWPGGFIGARQPDPTPNATSVIVFRADNTNILHAAVTIPNVAVNNVTGTRTFATIFQNLSGAPLRAGVTAQRAGGDGSINGYIGATSAPTQPVGSSSAVSAASAAAFICFDIPVGWYYKVNSDGPGLSDWTETSYV